MIQYDASIEYKVILYFLFVEFINNELDTESQVTNII